MKIKQKAIDQKLSKPIRYGMKMKKLDKKIIKWDQISLWGQPSDHLAAKRMGKRRVVLAYPLLKISA